ncbi:SPOR domain-containing protein [Photobacterium minamisatsumaniensis]|uniref:SPOR domain-containing protein n=1 Tax=Photobacterium minamisatsumaniensis TaxID=2910233 RepID=UPI003D0BC3AB
MLSKFSATLLYSAIFLSSVPASLAKPQPNDILTCSATPLTSGWQRLNEQCDIGTGLWGRDPQQHQGSFWLQCNYSQAIPAKKFSSSITGTFPASSYLINDGNKYRCLIGPFNNHTQAESAKVKLANIDVKSTFIRQTQRPIVVEASAKQLAPILQAAAEEEQSPTTKTVPVSKQTLIEERVVLDSAIYSFTFNNIKYYQPKNIQSDKTLPPAFVKENEQYWSRTNIQSAGQWCERFGLRLPTYDELKHLQTYGQRFLLRNHWPITNSYWSDTINPYTGEIKTLNLRNGKYDEYRPLALLYTACVAENS